MQIAANTGPDNNVISMTCKVNDVGLCKNTQVLIQTATAHTMKIKTILSSFILKTPFYGHWPHNNDLTYGYSIYLGGEKVNENL